jgi:CHAD domain-containing protein
MADGKWVAGLTPDMPVDEAALVVLGARFRIVRQYLPLAVEKPYHDPEHVHQLRVGTRRAAAALRAFGGCLPRKALRAAKHHLRTIRRAAGDARDWDVFRLGLARAKPLAGPDGRPARDFLAGYAFGERAAAQRRLAEAAAAAGPGFAEVADDLPSLVREPDGEAPSTLGVLAAAQFGELLRAFTAAAAANPTEPADLHQLRILGKRLRYALELFADCLPPAAREAAYPAVERVQELLGEVQDAAVGVDRLAALKDRVRLAAPADWLRVERGVEGLVRAARAKLPAGRAAFAAWRKEWAEVVAGLGADVPNKAG